MMEDMDKKLLDGEQENNEQNQFDNKVHEEGQEESEDSDGWDGSGDDNEDDEDLDDYEHDIQDDILKPASTRSKIVVNLREYKDKNGKRRPFTKDDEIVYEMDPYDKVRMRLLRDDEELYKKYLKTIEQLSSNPNLQPKKIEVPCCYKWPIIFFEGFVLLVLVYVFFLIIQLALFNLVILGIIFVFMQKIYHIFEALRWKFGFSYKTKRFSSFIKQQNEEVYKDMAIEIIPEREGLWLEFLLKEEEQMFEEIIARRRERIFNERNQQAIEDMKKILNEYSKDKADQDNKNGQQAQN